MNGEVDDQGVHSRWQVFYEDVQQDIESLCHPMGDQVLASVAFPMAFSLDCLQTRQQIPLGDDLVVLAAPVMKNIKQQPQCYQKVVKTYHNGNWVLQRSIISRGHHHKAWHWGVVSGPIKYSLETFPGLQTIITAQLVNTRVYPQFRRGQLPAI